MTCALCDRRAETRTPHVLCRAHAVQFWTGLVTLGGVTSRLYRAHPEMIPPPLYTHQPLAAPTPSPLDSKTVICRTCADPFWSRRDQRQTLCAPCRIFAQTRGGQRRRHN